MRCLSIISIPWNYLTIGRRYSADRSSKAYYAIYLDIDRARRIELIEMEDILITHAPDNTIGKKLLFQLHMDLLPGNL